LIGRRLDVSLPEYRGGAQRNQRTKTAMAKEGTGTKEIKIGESRKF